MTVLRLIRSALMFGGMALALAACENDSFKEEAESAVINALDDSNLSEIMLTAANPEDAAEYFRRSLATQPDRADFKRGYAISLARAKKYGEAGLAYRALVDAGQANDVDRVEFAHILARFDDWDGVAEQLGAVSGGHRAVRYEMAKAMLADHNEDWEGADRAYEAARQYSTEPAKVLNNWGVSMMARGDMKAAEGLYEQAVLFDPTLFEAKNNLAISYALQKQYRLPLVTLTEEEKALLYHNMAVVAIRQGDKAVARGLLTQAVQLHPRHFQAAADKLAQLDAVVEG